MSAPHEALDPVLDYLQTTARTLAEVIETQRDPIRRAGDLVARALAADGLVHVFGSGHSHLLAAEMFYRAGGLAAVNPVFVDGLLLHSRAALSTRLERTSGLGQTVWTDLEAGPLDPLVVISNSGSNTVAVEMARAARAAGNPVIALMSVRHAESAGTLARGHEHLGTIADVVIDTCGAPGDAGTPVPGVATPMGPTSTVVGAAVMHAIAIGAAAALAASGHAPSVLSSSNLAGGDALNAEHVARYRSRVRAL